MPDDFQNQVNHDSTLLEMDFQAARFHNDGQFSK
jgi:hypothetical protein